MTRRRFTAADMDAAWKRANGHCEKCDAQLMAGRFDYDHRKAHGLGGKSILSNCQVLCKNCHVEKTTKVDRPPMQKADNVRHKHIGFRKKRTIRAWRNFRQEIVRAND